MKTEFDFVGSVKVEINKYGLLVIYDINGNVIYSKNLQGSEYWCEYDKNNNCIHYKNSDNFEIWYEYDLNGKMIHSEDSTRSIFYP